MRRDAPLTYRGALRILGKHDRPALDALDALVGGFLLATPAVAPLAAWFGWIDQKNEAVGLVRRMLDAVSARLSKTRGNERQQLVCAAHTTIVVSAFFEALEEVTGQPAYRALELTEDDKRRLADLPLATDSGLVKYLYSAPVPMPSASMGFFENLDVVSGYLEGLANDVTVFIRGLAAGQLRQPGGPFAKLLVSTALDRYQSHYLRLSAEVPEFQVWAMLGEHAATRAQVRVAASDVLAVLDRHGQSLSTLEDLLRLTVPAGGGAPARTIAVLQRVNRSALGEVIVPAGALRHVDAVRFPTVEEIYVTPRYRAATYVDASRPADEQWWDSMAVHDNLDVFLTAHFCSPESTESPLLVLGHPGAGKSLFTKVLAARLPAESYTVVRVPLRRVDADAPVYRQIQQALDNGTHARLDWSDVADDSGERIRVVLLDGFDELVQATTQGRTAYLQEIAEFQRLEAAQDRPVAVVVTSRTVVAERARIPDGTLIVRVEDFSDAQVESWLAAWRTTNEAAIDRGVVRALSAASALRHADLARQPLLLLMLALYVADPSTPAIDEGLSTAALYERLLDNFVRRELGKLDPPPPEDELDDAVQDRLWRLAVAAFAMFNRGQQHISEEDLGGDLAVLAEPGGTTTVNPARLGQRAIGQFFFIYVSEADAHRDDGGRRSYEFLHATFGEYLVARQAVDLLAELAGGYRAGRRASRDIDDDLLFALLSHQPLAARPSVLVFAAERFVALGDPARHDMAAVLEALLTTARNRQGTGRFAGYRPLPPDRVREIGAYTANLVLLRVYLDSTVDRSRLSPDLEAWRSTVRLWRAALDEAGWLAVVAALDVSRDGSRVYVRGGRLAPSEYPEVGYAQLCAHVDLDRQLRAGIATYSGFIYWSALETEPSIGELFALLVSRAYHDDAQKPILWKLVTAPDYYRSLPVRVWLAIGPYLRGAGPALPYKLTGALVRLALDCRPDNETCPDLAVAIATYPQLLDDIPELANTVRWAGVNPPAWVAVVLAAPEQTAPTAELRAALATMRRNLPQPSGVGRLDGRFVALAERLLTGDSQPTHS